MARMPRVACQVPLCCRAAAGTAMPSLPRHPAAWHGRGWTCLTALMLPATAAPPSRLLSRRSRCRAATGARGGAATPLRAAQGALTTASSLAARTSGLRRRTASTRQARSPRLLPSLARERIRPKLLSRWGEGRAERAGPPPPLPPCALSLAVVRLRRQQHDYLPDSRPCESSAHIHRCGADSHPRRGAAS